jgi:hypothetical protein
MGMIEPRFHDTTGAGEQHVNIDRAAIQKASEAKHAAATT